MSLFKKREQAAPSPATETSGARIKLLSTGAGCVNCATLERSLREAMAHMGLDLPVEHITDLRQIASYGVMSVPALVVDGKVVSVGRALRPDEVEKLLEPLVEE